MKRINAIGPEGQRRRMRPRQLARAAKRGWRRNGEATNALSQKRSARVVHVIPWDLTIGGIQRMVDQWCERDGRNWDTHIVTPGLRGEFPFPHARVHAQISPERAATLLMDLAPDLLVHHGPSASYGHYDRCPVVWGVHSQLVFAEARPRWCEPVAILSNYHPTAAELGPGWRAAKINAIPLGVDLSRFQPSPLTAGIVGRLSEEKVPPAFVDALIAWGNPGGKWRLRLVGNGIANAYQKRLRQRLGPLEWIEFTGDTMPEHMASRYESLDALLVPSARESGSFAVVEALACGVPVVARDVGGVGFTAGGAARLVRRDDEFFAALGDLEDAAVRAEMARQGRREAKRRHDGNGYVSTQSEVFRRALNWPIFDVLLPVHNTRPDWLYAAYGSIRDQTHPAGKVVIVDDGSTERSTIAALDELAAIENVELVRLPENRGIAAALNAGLENCAAEFVARMDADDVARRDRFAKQARFLAANPKVDVLGGQIAWSKRQGQTHHPPIVTRDTATGSDWFVNHPTVVFRRRTVVDVGGYPDVPAAQDLALWLNILATGVAIYNLPDVVLTYREHANQATAQPEHAQLVARVRREYHA